MNDYLFKNKRTENGEITHTRIPDKSLNIYGGSYTMPNNDEFLKQYYRDIILTGKNEYLTEKQLDNGPIAIDLDFRYTHDVTVRQHNKETIKDFLFYLTEPLKKYYSFDNYSKFDVFVMEKPNVNVLEDGSLTKDGIHFIIGLNMNKSIKKQYRMTLLSELEKQNDIDLHLINNWDSVLDKGVLEATTNWQLFGSKKPENETYELTQHFTFGFDTADKEFTMFETPVPGTLDFETFKKLSVRNTERPEIQMKPIKVIEKTRNTTKLQSDTEAITDTESDNEASSKLQELLKLINIDKKDRTTWMRICSCIKYNGLTNNDWLEFCKANGLNMDTEKVELFKNLNPYPIEIHYLQSLAKKSNPNSYKLWLEKYDVYYINADDLDDPYKTAVTISNTLKDTLILCKECWYMLTDNQLWKQQKEPSFYIINELRKYIDESNKKLVYKISQTEGEQKEKLIEKSKIYLKSYKSVSGSSYLNVLTKYLKTLLADDKFADKLDSNKGQLAFQNGIMDLETKVFRQGILSSDFITQTIPFDYAKGDETKKKFLKSVLLKILNNNEEHLEYFLSIIGYTFIGSPNLEKSIYFCVDKTNKASGDNGKTFFFDILTALLPNYVYKSKGSLLEEGNAKVHKQLVMMKGKRLVWLDEFGKKKSNSELMKEIGDGLNIENEVMFGTSETINIMFKLFTLTNNMPIIDPKDTAVYNRYKQISYGSHFDRTGNRLEEDEKNLLFIADTSLGDKIKAEYYNEVFDLVIEYANKYYSKKIPTIPSQFVKDTKETQKNNDLFANWFDENCETDINERVALKAIVSQSGMSEKLVKEGMTRLGFKYDKDLSKLGKDENNKAYKGGFVGVKLLEIIDKDDDC